MLLIDILFYLFYAATCVSCLRMARIEFGTPISITSMFTLPYLCICTFQEIMCLSFDFFDIPSAEYWLINSIFIAFTYIVELSLNRLTKKKSAHFLIIKTIDKFNIPRIFFLLSTLIIIYVVYSSIKMVGSIDVSMLLQDDFQDDFGESAGGSFYMRLLTIILTVYFLGVGHSKLGYVLGCLCFVPHIIVNTKGVLFIPVIATLITRVLLGRIVSIKYTMLVIGIVGVLIFFFSYMMEFFTYGDTPMSDLDRWIFISEKLIFYTLSGVQEFCINIRDSICHNPMYNNITLTPFFNLLSKFGLTESISSINQEIYRPIGQLPHYGIAYSNVNGYIGTLFVFNGIVGGLLLHLFWILITFVIRCRTYAKNQSCYVVLYSLFLSGFFLGWFDFYFMQTFWVYFIILTIMIDWVFRISNKRI